MTRHSESHFGTNSSPVPSPSRRARFGWVRTACESAPERPIASGVCAGFGLRGLRFARESSSLEVGSPYGLLSAPRRAFNRLGAFMVDTSCTCSTANFLFIVSVSANRPSRQCRKYEAKLVNLLEAFLPTTMLAPVRIGATQATRGSGCFCLRQPQHNYDGCCCCRWASATATAPPTTVTTNTTMAILPSFPGAPRLPSGRRDGATSTEAGESSKSGSVKNFSSSDLDGKL